MSTGTTPNLGLVYPNGDDPAAMGDDRIKAICLAIDTLNPPPRTRTISAGTGLTGGGDLTANRTINVGSGTGITVAADSIALDTAYTDGRYVNTTGDDMTGTLGIKSASVAAMHLKDDTGVVKGVVRADVTTSKLGIYGGSDTQSTAGVLWIERDKINSPDMYRGTRVGTANLGAFSDGQIARCTTSVMHMSDVAPLGDVATPSEVPSDRRAPTTAAVQPDPYAVLRVVPVTYIPDDDGPDTAQRVGLVAENVAVHMPWAVNADSIDTPAVIATLLHVVRDQQTRIVALEAR